MIMLAAPETQTMGIPPTFASTLPSADPQKKEDDTITISPGLGQFELPTDSDTIITAFKVVIDGNNVAPGRNVTIVAHEVVFNDSAGIDTSAPANTDDLPAKPGTAARIGATGATGGTGGPTTNGGNVTILAVKIRGTVDISATVGKAGKGGPGGDGAPGQPAKYQMVQPFRVMQTGVDGGQGGQGGQGGTGGNGGNITIRLLQPPAITTKSATSIFPAEILQSLLTTLPGTQSRPVSLKLSNDGGEGGEGGDPGMPGSGGHFVRPGPVRGEPQFFGSSTSPGQEAEDSVKGPHGVTGQKPQAGSIPADLKWADFAGYLSLTCLRTTLQVAESLYLDDQVRQALPRLTWVANLAPLIL